jgi:hypothetical protein
MSNTNWWIVYNPALRSSDDIQAIMTHKHHTAYAAWSDSTLPGSPPFGEVRVEPWTTERFEVLDKIAEAAEVPAMTPQEWEAAE